MYIVTHEYVYKVHVITKLQIIIMMVYLHVEHNVCMVHLFHEYVRLSIE